MSEDDTSLTPKPGVQVGKLYVCVGTKYNVVSEAYTDPELIEELNRLDLGYWFTAEHKHRRVAMLRRTFTFYEAMSFRPKVGHLYLHRVVWILSTGARFEGLSELWTACKFLENIVLGDETKPQDYRRVNLKVERRSGKSARLGHRKGSIEALPSRQAELAPASPQILAQELDWTQSTEPSQDSASLEELARQYQKEDVQKMLNQAGAGESKEVKMPTEEELAILPLEMREAVVAEFKKLQGVKDEQAKS